MEGLQQEEPDGGERCIRLTSIQKNRILQRTVPLRVPSLSVHFLTTLCCCSVHLSTFLNIMSEEAAQIGQINGTKTWNEVWVCEIDSVQHHFLSKFVPAFLCSAVWSRFDVGGSAIGRQCFKIKACWQMSSRVYVWLSKAFQHLGTFYNFICSNSSQLTVKKCFWCSKSPKNRIFLILQCNRQNKQKCVSWRESAPDWLRFQSGGSILPSTMSLLTLPEDTMLVLRMVITSRMERRRGATRFI